MGSSFDSFNQGGLKNFVESPFGARGVLGGEGTVIVGGRFDVVDGVSDVFNIAAWNPLTDTWVKFNKGLSGFVFTSALFEGKLVVGGSFTNDRDGTDVLRIAYWDDSDKSWNPIDGGMNSGITRLVVFKGELYATGSFTLAGSTSVLRIAKISSLDGTWQDVGGGVTAGTQVNAAHVRGNNLYLGGRFSEIGGVAANSVASWNGLTYSALGDGLVINFGSGNGNVRSLNDFGGNITADGNFNRNGGGTTVRGMGEFGGTEWSEMDGGANPVFTAADQAKYAGALYTANGAAYNNHSFVHTSVWDGSTLSAIPGGDPNNVTQAVGANEVAVYFGGNFTTIGGISATRIAKLTGASWTPLGAGTNKQVFHINPLDVIIDADIL